MVENSEKNWEEVLKEKDEQVRQLEEQVAYLTEQLDYMKRLLFGKKKETLDKVSNNCEQLVLFDWPSSLPEDIEEEITISEVKSHRRCKKRYRLKDALAKYPVEEIHHYLEGKDCLCPNCQEAMKEIGESSHSDEVVYIPEQVKIRRHYQHSYVCSNYEAHGQDIFKKSALPQKPIQQSLASASMISEVMSQKFEYCIPLNRQEKRWQRLGLPLTRRTLSQWIITSSERYLSPLFDLLHKKLLKEKSLHADETPVKVLESEKGKNFCWLTRTVEVADHPIVLYFYDESRSASVIKAFLKGFKGHLHCDGYSAYSNLKGVTPVRCLSHIRRQFYNCQPKLLRTSLAYEAVQFCDKMFKVERNLKALHLNEEKEVINYRKKYLKPLFKQFQVWLNNRNALPKTALGEAIAYAKKFFPSLQELLKNPKLSLSNNIAERSLRQVALGRKNWLFSKSYRGAKANLICLSIIQTAIENGLNAWKYLNYLLDKLANLPTVKKENLEACLPWSSEVQAICK